MPRFWWIRRVDRVQYRGVRSLASKSFLLLGILACSNKPVVPGIDGGSINFPCTLPGSWVTDASGTHVVPGGNGEAGFSWLTVPTGFCVHAYATVPNARQLRFAPGGELFVASPTTGTTSNGQNGLAAIVVVPDDNHDGYGDQVQTFLGNLPSTQGLLFANGSLYYQDHVSIRREPYDAGQRVDNGLSEVVADITVYASSLHWPKTLDIADDGTIYVGNGGDQQERCQQPMPFHGGILAIDGSAGGREVAMGLRNPIDVKCHHDGHDHCFATELSLDYSASSGGREKLITIADGDNWGYPCCATEGLAYTSVSVPCPNNPTAQCPPDCSAITPEADSFVIGNTPFGFEFEDQQFPVPWDHKVFVVLHGVVGTWTGARLVAISTDPATGLPLTGSTLSGSNSGKLTDFATGWDDGSRSHGRPADLTLSPDGRLFVANDQTGEIFWIAPVFK